ncbi:MAG: hypothetical protein Q9226_003059 [Calogaya cf. arnoldii]
MREFYEKKSVLLERIDENYYAVQAMLHLLDRGEIWKASPTSIKKDGTLDRKISKLRKKLLDHSIAFTQVTKFFQRLDHRQKNDFEQLARVAEECVDDSAIKACQTSYQRQSYLPLSIHKLDPTDEPLMKLIPVDGRDSASHNSVAAASLLQVAYRDIKSQTPKTLPPLPSYVPPDVRARAQHRPQGADQNDNLSSPLSGTPPPATSTALSGDPIP